MPASREKEERMWALAEKLARSGKYSRCQQIEWELRKQGFGRARQLFDDEDIRKKFDLLCAASKSREKKS
jgi:hypothetical protein